MQPGPKRTVLIYRWYVAGVICILLSLYAHFSSGLASLVQQAATADAPIRILAFILYGTMKYTLPVAGICIVVTLTVMLLVKRRKKDEA